MSVADKARSLIAYSNAYVQNSIAASTRTSDSISTAMQLWQAAKEANADSLTKSLTCLGSNHGSFGAIVGSSATLGVRMNAIDGLMQATLDEIVLVNQEINGHANLLADIGHQVLRGGR
jgi:hypothetical protein